MTTLFISDLHLCDQQPDTTRSFLQFCQNQAREARALYILGDFFEYWLGDDALDKTAKTAQAALRSLSDDGIELFFMAGNRDFLLGTDYASDCGMTLLTEPHIIRLNDEPVLLVHGDAECTDDLPYQQIRKQFRDPNWQQQFLSLPIAERIEFARQAREASREHTQNTGQMIMDVNPQAIDALFSQHQVNTLIHGHTHRPAIHEHGGKRRIVLGDWHHQISYLRCDDTGFTLYSQ